MTDLQANSLSWYQSTLDQAQKVCQTKLGSEGKSLEPLSTKQQHQNI